MAQKIQQQLRDVGLKLENPPASKDVLVKLLKQAANCLSELDQSPLPSVLDSMKPCLNSISKQEYLKHQDRDVKVLVATCICEITRITAPEAPYGDDVLKDIFQLIVGTFKGLGDMNSPSFGRRVVILETLARYRSCVVMLDLECTDLINEMFHTFFDVISDDHPENVMSSMQTIMSLILDEGEDVAQNLLTSILSVLGRKRNDFSMAARKLAMNVIEQCAGKLEPCIKQFLVSSLSGDNGHLNSQLDYHEVIHDLYQCAPQILNGIIPYLTGELLTDKLEVRRKAVQLLGELFALPGRSISESFQPLFSEFLKRLTDRVVEVRLSVIEHVKNCLISNPSRSEATQIIAALCDRLLDYEENVRKQVVAAICDLACHSLEAIPVDTAKLVAERLRDKSLSVKSYTMERLADLYKLYCVRSSDGSTSLDEFEWIPGKILRCLCDKDFRSETIELIICGSLFSPDLSVKSRVQHWLAFFPGLDRIEVKALEQLLMQKQRLQSEMQNYLSLRQKFQEGESPELRKRISSCVRSMSRFFNDSAKAEESFQILNQLKDVNIWKILTTLLDPCTSFHQAWVCRDDLLKILGERHPLYAFMGLLGIKCSHLLFNKDLVKEILSVAGGKDPVADAKLLTSCMNMLTMIGCFSPLLLVGSEEDLVHLLKEDNEVVKEGIAHVLAKAGGAIREKSTMTTSSVDLLLERLCLEGTRKQAKYSVQALAAITKDDGLMSLSVLYKRLVDILEERTHLPAILQSLGCIAQTAMPVFETREDEIVEFITSKILVCSIKTDESSKSDWNDRSELCMSKIFGLKTLVKSYLPLKDAHLRPGIEKLLGILKKVLSFGNVSTDIESSAVDRAHMRLAAAKSILRLSRQWDHKISADIFYMTIGISEDNFSESRKIFLGKVHQYIKDRLLDAKYACAFLYNIAEPDTPEFENAKHHLREVILICQQVKARQLSMQCETGPLVPYPEYIVAYLVHALAHHPLCPNIDECKEIQAYEPIYWRLHLLLSMLLDANDGSQSGGSLEKKKESYTSIISIFDSIKHAEDVLDVAKSKTSHAICGLGLSVAKSFVRDLAGISEITISISLPAMLYKHVESESENHLDHDDTSWLSGANAMAHFEGLNVQKEKIGSGVIKNEMDVKESDRGGNEVPLSQVMKLLKAQGGKNKRIVKKQTSPQGIENAENDFDILGVVREINLGNTERSQGIETGKLTKVLMNSKNRQIASENTFGKFSGSRKGKGNKLSSEVVVPAPKRRRSTSMEMSLSKSTKKKRESSEMPSFHSIKSSRIANLSPGDNLPNDRSESTDSDLLVSCLPTVKSKSLGSGRKDPERSQVSDIASDAKKIDNSKSSTGSTKKRKRRSIAGLAKCSSNNAEKDQDELVGLRIKVWWPMDKRFYEGVVQSYDPGKKKHDILYDDGDIEVLNLSKEKWDIVNQGSVPAKKSKLHELPSHRDDSPEGTNSVSDSRKNKSSSKKSSSSEFRRRASKSIIESDRGGVSDHETDADLPETRSKGDSDLSDGHPYSASEVDDVSSEEKQAAHISTVGDGTEVSLREGLNESGEENAESSSSDDKGDSDEEPLSAWRQRTGKAL